MSQQTDGSTASSQQHEVISARLIKRYRDGYHLGAATVTFGTLLKVIAFLFGFGLFAAGVLMSMNLPGSSSLFAIIGSIVVGVVAWAVLFALGMLVAANGQMLRAVLDTAVNSHQSLNEFDKLKAIGVKLTS